MPTTTDIRVNDLIINKMTQEQYDALQDKSPTELYVVEGDSNVIYAEQAVELPTASESNLGRIYQYIGITNQNYINGYFYQNQSEDLSDLTIEQTVGSSLSNLAIDLDTFIEIEQPTQDETITFVRVGGGDISVSPTTGTNHGITATITDAELFWNQVQYDFAQWGTSDPLLYVNVEYGSSNWDKIKLQLHTANSTYNHAWYTRSEAEAFGVSVTGTLEGSYSYFAVISNIQAHESGHEHWEKDNVEVDPANYGISYKGTPEINDELTVTYIHSSINYKWNQVDVQPAVDPLPDQTGQSGKFLTTDGTNASWGDALVNTATGTKSISVMTATATGGGAIAIGNNSSNYSTGAQATRTGAIAIGGGSAQGIYCARALGDNCIAIGPRSTAGENGRLSAIAIGETSTSNGNQSIAIGLYTNVTGHRSVLIGSNEQGYRYSVTENDTMYFQNNNGQFKLLNSNGTIPTDRFTTTPVAAGTYMAKIVVDEQGTVTRSWGSAPDPLPSQTGQAGKFLTTDGTTAAWETSTAITFRTWGANE